MKLGRFTNFARGTAALRPSAGCATTDSRGLSIQLLVATLLLPCFLVVLTGCDDDAYKADRNMKVQPRFDPMEPTSLFPDGRSERPKVEGTVARGQLRIDREFYEGVVNGKVIDHFPASFTL